MGKSETFVSLSLTGELAADYITKRRGALQAGDHGTFYVGTIATTGEEGFTELGPTSARYDLSPNGNKVILSTLWDWKSESRYREPRFKERKVAVNNDGLGKQQITRGVDLIIKAE